jgi:ATP-dependent helicase/nuclease subunit A
VPTPPEDHLVIADQAERDRLVGELSRNVMVDASAGSGKTQSLSLRMAEGLLRGAYDPARMAAVTFTRKAAAELRGRLQMVLEAALENEQDPSRRERAVNALDHLDLIFVGTIHAFCSRLLREFPVESGLSPGFRELDPLARSQMLAQVYRRVLEEAPALMPDTVRAFSEGEVTRASLDSGLQKVCENQDVLFEVPLLQRPDMEGTWSGVGIFASQLRGALPAEMDPETTCALQKIAPRFLQRVARAERTSVNELLTLLKDWTRELKVIQKWWPGSDAKERKQNAQAALELAEDFVSDTVQPFLRQWRAYLYSHCQHLFAKTRSDFQAERRRSAQLDFSDLLHESARVLRENRRVRSALKTKCRWLFVDEFQDTDPVQAEVITLLASEDDYHDADWTLAPLRAGALFVVGDPKQSIYRFRRADIGTYNFVKSRIRDTGGLLLSLTASFRSVPALCTWSNDAFQKLFPEDSTDVQAAFSGLQPVRREGKGKWSGVFTLTDHSDTQDWNKVSLREAQRIADLIQQAVTNGDYAWGDFLILTTKTAEVRHYAAALEERAIPVESSGGSAEESHWLGVLKGLLQVLADPHDAVETVGVLRGPLFGVSDQDLFLHRQAGGYFCLLGVDENSPGHPSVNGALSTLLTSYRLSRDLPAGAGVERILETSGILALAACSDPGDGEVPSLLQWADKLRTATLEGRSLAQALRDVELLKLERPVSLRTGRHNVVRVMNLHQSKGLQATVVFLAAPTNGMSRRADERIVRKDGHAQGFLALKRPGPFGAQGEIFAAPLDWEQHEAAEVEALEAERLRLLYVAATRAKDVMVVGRWSGSHGKAKRAWEPFDPFLEGVEELPWPCASIPVPSQMVTIDDANTAYLERTAGWAQCATPSWSRSSVTATQRQETITVESAPAVPGEREDRVDAGPAWGDLVHKLLEQAMRGPNRDRDHLTRLGRWFVFDSPELTDLVPLAVDTVMEVMETDFWREALANEERLVEVPFGVRGEDGRTLLFGVLDLAMKSGQEWQIVDYKSDLSPMEALAQKYAGQIGSYARNWAQITQEKVGYAGVFRVRSGELSKDLGRPDSGR